jgi:hypothetical protein
LRCSGSSSGVCGLLGVDKILDFCDIDLISRRAEREDEYGFVGERCAARAFTMQLRLQQSVSSQL